MRPLRIWAALPVLAICATTFAQQRVAVGKVGQTNASTGVYVSPSTHSRVYYWVPPDEQLVVRKTSSPNWVAVWMRHGNYGYARTANFDILPYIVYASTAKRSIQLASRGESPVISGPTGSYLADKALEYQGTPYEWGGNDLNGGVDCSGFVKELVGQIGGQSLPRTAAEQALVGMAIHRYQDLRPGDRLYFKEKSDTKITHTGIYIGNWRFVHSSHGKGKVTTDTLLKPGWQKMLVAARR